jgi:hypothetical protein
MSWEFKSPHPHFIYRINKLPSSADGELFFARLTAANAFSRPLSMLVLKISNAPEVVASKLGKFLEALTPDAFDQATIEDVLIKELIKNLAAEGLKGEVAAVKGLDLQDSKLVIEETLHVRRHQQF